MERVYNGCTKVLYRRWILFLCEIFREFVDNYKIWDEKPGSAYKTIEFMSIYKMYWQITAIVVD